MVAALCCVRPQIQWFQLAYATGKKVDSIRFSRRITFLVFSGILIGCIILLPPEIVFFNQSQYYFLRKKYYATYQTTVEYEKWYIEAYILMNPIAWLYRRAQPKDSILYITLHSFDRFSFLLLVSAWEQGYRICSLKFLHKIDQNILTPPFWPYHFVHDILSTTFCPWHFVHDILSTTFCPLHFVRDILSTTFCPWHFVQWHFVHITFCPRHFVRYILSGDILVES